MNSKAVRQQRLICIRVELNKKKNAERKTSFEPLCRTLIYLLLDKTRQIQFTRSLLKWARNQCWYRARGVLSTALSSTMYFERLSARSHLHSGSLLFCCSFVFCFYTMHVQKQNGSKNWICVMRQRTCLQKICEMIKSKKFR